MSKSYYDSLIATVYLLKSPANAQHLEDAIAEYKAGKTQEHDLISTWTEFITYYLFTNPLSIKDFSTNICVINFVLLLR